MRCAWVALVAGCGFQSALPAPDGNSGASFDVAQCPASYSVALPGPSRYRLIAAGNPAWIQSDACNADLPGVTHLVVLDSMQELSAVTALLDATSGIALDALWIGAVQPRTVSRADEGWLAFDGQPMISQWAANEPNDGTTETDHTEQFARLERARRALVDAPGNDSNGALCECDGRPLAASAASAIAASRR